MDSSTITLDDRFTPLELATMFTVDCAPNIDHKDGSRTRNDDSPYAFNDIKVPLWTITKKAPSRGVKHAIQGKDNIKAGISIDPPGSERRIEALRAYYQNVNHNTPCETLSAFNC